MVLHKRGFRVLPRTPIIYYIRQNLIQVTTLGPWPFGKTFRPQSERYLRSCMILL
jgi:hypothetical protein